MGNCSPHYAFTPLGIIAFNLHKSDSQNVASLSFQLCVPLLAICMFNELFVNVLYLLVFFSRLVRFLYGVRKLAKYFLQIFSSDSYFDLDYLSPTVASVHLYTNDHL